MANALVPSVSNPLSLPVTEQNIRDCPDSAMYCSWSARVMSSDLVKKLMTGCISTAFVSTDIARFVVSWATPVYSIGTTGWLTMETLREVTFDDTGTLLYESIESVLPDDLQVMPVIQTLRAFILLYLPVLILRRVEKFSIPIIEYLNHLCVKADLFINILPVVTKSTPIALNMKEMLRDSVCSDLKCEFSENARNKTRMVPVNKNVSNKRADKLLASFIKRIGDLLDVPSKPDGVSAVLDELKVQCCDLFKKYHYAENIDRTIFFTALNCWVRGFSKWLVTFIVETGEAEIKRLMEDVYQDNKMELGKRKPAYDLKGNKQRCYLPLPEEKGVEKETVDQSVLLLSENTSQANQQADQPAISQRVNKCVELDSKIEMEKLLQSLLSMTESLGDNSADNPRATRKKIEKILSNNEQLEMMHAYYGNEDRPSGRVIIKKAVEAMGQ